MKAILSILIFCIMLFVLMLGMVAEIDIRQQREEHRRAYNRVLEERALNQYLVSQEWHNANYRRGQ